MDYTVCRVPGGWYNFDSHQQCSCLMYATGISTGNRTHTYGRLNVPKLRIHMCVYIKYINVYTYSTEQSTS
jgi:hypothetical protein